MSVYKLGSKPEFMTRPEGILEQVEVAQVVCSLSFEGLQMAAALGLALSRQLEITPVEVDEMLTEMISGENLPPISIQGSR